MKLSPTLSLINFFSFFFFIFRSGGSGGTILTNGQPRDMSLFRKLSRYIMQEDIIQHNLTVEECMIISANLKLGKSRSKEEKLVAVSGFFVLSVTHSATERVITSAKADAKSHKKDRLTNRKLSFPTFFRSAIHFKSKIMTQT